MGAQSAARRRLCWTLALLVLRHAQPSQQEAPEVEAEAASSETDQQSEAARCAPAPYLVAPETERLLNRSRPVDARVAELLERVSPDMRPMRDWSAHFDDITTEEARLAWRLMREHARTSLASRLAGQWPKVKRLLEEANVSAECRTAAGRTVAAARRLDSWAIQMLSAWGDFPAAGLFEGTYGSIGSFHGCVRVPDNPDVGHAHYCTLAFRPVLPARRAYELIVSPEPRALLDLFERPAGEPEDAFHELARHAQYHHYVYYKLGTCWPIGCSPRDVQAVGRLLGRRSILMSGPVKCSSSRESDYSDSSLQISTRDLNAGLYVWRPHMTRAQQVAGLVLLAALGLVVALTLLDLCWPKKKRQNNECELKMLKLPLPEPEVRPATADKSECWLRAWAHDYSLRTSIRHFLEVSQSQVDNDILCINGIRCLTMSWIIVTHTMQYNDWSAFARTREIETHLKSLINQPIFNGSYLVDTFFLISGLLTSFSSFRQPSSSGQHTCAASSSEATLAELRRRFSACNYLLGRYLRLTPQILFVSLLFIVLPLLSSSGGPHWYTMTGEYSENCAQNWWVNLLHIEAFYRPSQMCNFVCWWVSVDMLFHLFALAVIVASFRLGLGLVWRACALLALLQMAHQAERHFRLGLPPNLLSTIPQTGAMWSRMTLESFWTPQAHALPFFLGLYLGFLMAQRGRQLEAWFRSGGRRVRLGWWLTGSALLAQSYSTYFWVTGAWSWSQWASSGFQTLAPAVWAACVSWIIVACHYGRGGHLNRLLSARLFLVLGKASYLVYLSHFLVLFTFFGAQNLLVEPTQLMMLYVIIGNVCLSMLLGALLCIGFELPWLKTQRRLMSRLG